MKQNFKTILLLILFVACAIWIFPIVIGHMATLYIPITSKLPHNRIMSGALLSAGGACSAAICAFLLAWPLGYLTKENPIIVGIAFGLISTALPVIAFIETIIENGFNGFVTSILVVEQLTFVAVSVLSACWGSRVAKKMTTQAKP